MSRMVFDCFVFGVFFFCRLFRYFTSPASRDVAQAHTFFFLRRSVKLLDVQPSARDHRGIK